MEPINNHSPKNILRWILVPIAAYAVFHLSSILLFIAAVINVIPFQASLILFGLVGGFFAILTGMYLAPAHKIKTGAILALTLPLLFVILSRSFHSHDLIQFVATAFGGLLAVLIQRKNNNLVAMSSSRKPYLYGLLGILVIIGGFLFARIMDFPARPDSLPNQGLGKLNVSSFYSYRLAGFIDETYLWRMDAEEETVRTLADSLDLEEIRKVQDDFFYWRPYWWPKKLPSNYLAFRSPGYEIGTRPSDDWYYYLVYDKDKKRAYIWVDQNF